MSSNDRPIVEFHDFQGGHVLTAFVDTVPLVDELIMINDVPYKVRERRHVFTVKGQVTTCYLSAQVHTW